MIGYFLPEDQKALSGSSEEDPHITMAYLGKEVTPDRVAALSLVLSTIGSRNAPLVGRLDGIARFSATPSSDGMDVMVRLANVPYLECLREDICDAAELVGAPAKRNHGYVPHMTLAYVPPESDVPLKASPLPVLIDRITLAVSGVHYDFPLTGQAMEKAITLTSPSGIAVDKQWTIPFVKVDAAKQQVFGWAGVIKVGDTDIEDLQGDVISEADQEDAAYDFVLNSRASDAMHDERPIGTLIESMMFTREKQAALNIDLGKVGWWVGFKIHDAEVWKKIQKGEYRAFSIGGTGSRVPLT